MIIMANNTAPDAAQADEKVLESTPRQRTGTLSPDEPHDHPDDVPGDDDDHQQGGTRAWLAITGSFWIYFTSSCVINSSGFFQAFYRQEYLKNYSPSVISFIGTLQITLMYLSGSVVGVLFDVYSLPHLGNDWSQFAKRSVSLQVPRSLSDSCAEKCGC